MTNVLPILSRKKYPDSGPYRSQTINLRSGWDEMLSDSRKSKGFLPKIKTKSAYSYTISTSPEPSSSSSHCTTFPDDDTFMSSTLSYLGSPAAQTLGLSTHASVCAPPSPLLRTQLPKGPPRTVPPPEIPRIILPKPDDAVSTISSLWDKPWPQPPVTIPSPSLSCSSARSSRSQVGSVSSNEVGYPVVTPPHLRTRAFEGSGVPPKLALSSHPSMKDVRSRSREGYAPGDVIYMTGVQETV
jgi:pheromone a factor receptor